jgi:broad specificity phosphatase PhoE
MVSHQSPIWIARLAYEGRRGPPWLSRVRCSHASITSFEFDGERCTNHHYWAPE